MIFKILPLHMLCMYIDSTLTLQMSSGSDPVGEETRESSILFSHEDIWVM